MSGCVLLNFSLLPTPKFASYVCEIKKSFIMWQNTAWKTSPVLFSWLVDMVIPFSGLPRSLNNYYKFKDPLHIAHALVQFTSSSTQAAVPSAKPRLGDGSLAPTEEHLQLQMVSEKSEGGRRMRLCNCSPLFPGNLYIQILFFFLDKLGNAFETHTRILFSQFKPRRGSFVGCRIGEYSFKNF